MERIKNYPANYAKISEIQQAKDERVFVLNLLKTELMRRYFGHSSLTLEEIESWGDNSSIVNEVFEASSVNSEPGLLLKDNKVWDSMIQEIESKIQERNMQNPDQFKIAA